MVGDHPCQSLEWRNTRLSIRQAIVEPHCMIHSEWPKPSAVDSASRPTERNVNQEGASHIHNDTDASLRLAVHVLSMSSAERLGLKFDATVSSPTFRDEDRAVIRMVVVNCAT